MTKFFCVFRLQGVSRGYWSKDGLSFIHLFCTIALGYPMKFGEGQRIVRNQTKIELTTWIYECAKQNIGLSTVFKALKIA